jgi:hypothetical protein
VINGTDYSAAERPVARVDQKILPHSSFATAMRHLKMGILKMVGFI